PLPIPSLFPYTTLFRSDDVVTFTGLKQGEELASLLRGSDLMLMFSHYENLPVVISEALCCGVLVISSDVGGIREVLKPRYGTLRSEEHTSELQSRENLV